MSIVKKYGYMVLASILTVVGASLIATALGAVFGPEKGIDSTIEYARGAMILLMLGVAMLAGAVFFFGRVVMSLPDE